MTPHSWKHYKWSTDGIEVVRCSRYSWVVRPFESAGRYNGDLHTCSRCGLRLYHENGGLASEDVLKYRVLKYRLDMLKQAVNPTAGCQIFEDCDMSLFHLLHTT